VTAFLAGAGLMVVVGFAVMLVDDPEVRKATVTVLWGLAVGPVLLFLAGVVALVRMTGLRPRSVKGRKLSPAALHRFTGRLGQDAWVVTWRGGGLVRLKAKARTK
jgi:hypothetical protein